MLTKTLQILFCVFIIILSFSFAKKETITIQVQAKFGKRGSGCIGVGGVCALDPPNNQTRTQYDASTNIFLTKDGKIALEFLKNSISVSKAEEQFGTSFFEIEEPFEFSTSLCSALKLKSNSFIIKKGKYPITSTKGSYRVVF